MKHAYLIIAHTEFILLENLVRILDYPDNDIFIHIDKKTNYDIKYAPTFSRILTVPNERRVDVRWGEDSQIHSELALYLLATQNGTYDYYHLLSGVDMPIKPQDYIHKFFKEHAGTEFIGFMQNAWRTESKIRYYHFFISRPNKKNWKYYLHGGLVAIQKILNVKRDTLGWKQLAKGANWCSLTHQAVMFILKNEGMIRKRFKYTYACDEVYKQTLLVNSHFANSLFCTTNEYQGCLRLVDWKRGNPYVWKLDDLEVIMSSEMLFARKFSSDDMDIVNHLTLYLLSLSE